MSAARAGSSPAFGTILKKLRKPLLSGVSVERLGLPSELVPRVIDRKIAKAKLDS